MPKWTMEQQEAIFHDHENIIVSAGAGSGKTAVLTERVIQKLKKGVHVDELLVLTFTKAAAHEMKERIKKAIKKEELLQDELNRIDNSYITTFDSYALSVVKKYHYLLNISKDVSITDSSIIYLKKKSCLDAIFLELYQQKKPQFLKLIGDFCLKSDEDIKKYILSISNKLDLKYDKQAYLSNYLVDFYDGDKIDNDILKYEQLLLSKINKIDLLLTNLSNYIDIDYFNDIKLQLKGLLESSNYNDIKDNLNIKLPNLPRGSASEAKEYKNNIAILIKELNELCTFSDRDEIKEAIFNTRDYVEAIVEIMLLLDDEINSYKHDHDIYEFIDISKLAIKVLKENSDVTNEIKGSFNEIMIDEYQDTNDLQEEFISMIEDNNCYMVGDIKQSIYRFRNANPYIFKNKYDEYAKGNNGYKIDLTKNFRSRLEVLEDINKIFNLIMRDDIGGADYQNSHQMIFGNNTYLESGATSQNNHLEIYKYVYDVSKEYKKEELEAFIIANDIKEKVNNHYQVFDKENLYLRDIKYEDFAIIMDRSSKFDLYKKIFEYMDIPLMKYTDTSITGEIDILIIRNLIKLLIKVKNKEYDQEFKYVFLSIGRSFLFSVSDEVLFDIINTNNYFDCQIIKKINDLVPFIDSKTIYEIMNEIIWRFNFYEKLIYVGNIKESMERIEFLLGISSDLDDLGYDINEFLLYLDNIIDSDYDIKLSYSSLSSDSVKIMTIHKSKGLEYHLCYFPGIYSKFNISDLKEKITYDSNYGIITTYLKDGMENTIYKHLMKQDYMIEEISEKIRLFYVALTRAKEKMIILQPYILDKPFKEKEPLEYTSFLDMISSIDCIDELYTNIDLDSIIISRDYNKMKKTDYKKLIPNDDTLIDKRQLHLNYSLVSNVKYSMDIERIYTFEEKKRLEIGNNMHYLLEGINFHNPQIDKLMISDYYKEKLNLFFKLDLDLKHAKIYKEYKFKYVDNGLNKSGIIDLMLEYDDEIKIIDYKLKNIDDEAYQKQLYGYRKFVSTKTNKKITVYLYSIIDGVLKELEYAI